MKKLVAIRVEPETWKKIKAGAALQGVCIGDYLSKLIEKK